MCGAFSFRILCSTCRFELGEPSVGARRLELARFDAVSADSADKFNVYYFYNYSEIKPLILSKHKLVGSFVLKALANIAFGRFKREFGFPCPINAIPIDDRLKHGYSHTAILAHALKCEHIRPLYAVLHSSSDVEYSGKSMQFRLENPRNFKLLKRPKNPVILVDDVITSGLTILQARRVLVEAGIDVLFGLVLADARY
ncbi:phosphoribosyltransferase [Campylobacter sp. 19-13652]|nr:phosphoribosyltransferase [Campylobacter sp. 19-13652]